MRLSTVKCELNTHVKRIPMAMKGIRLSEYIHSTHVTVVIGVDRVVICSHILASPSFMIQLTALANHLSTWTPCIHEYYPGLPCLV